MQINHQTLSLSRLPLHVATVGVGDPVVLLHGWPQTWHEWRKVAPLLADRYRLVMPDLPGLGDSGRPKSGYDKKTLALDLKTHNLFLPARSTTDPKFSVMVFGKGSK